MKDMEHKHVTVVKRIDREAFSTFSALKFLEHFDLIDTDLFPSIYNENLVTEFYANLDSGIEDFASPTMA